MRYRITPGATRRRRGSMLIIAIGVLTLLAVLGTTFVSLMKLERQATKNYLDAQVVELVNDSALDRAIADLRSAVNHFSFTSVRSPWLYEVRDRSGNRFQAQGRLDIDDPRVGEWSILKNDKSRMFRYKIKVIDCAAQININGRQDSLARMLENLASAIQRSPWLDKGDAYPLYTGPKQSGERLTGVQIIEFRNKLEGHRFRSKSQLRDLIGSENYETIKDFITAYGWEDPYTFKPSDGLDEIQLLKIGRSGGGRAVGGGAQQVEHNPVNRPTPPIGLEPRAPININTAPEEVLTAVLMGVGGRRAFPYARLTYTGIDEGASILGQRVLGQEEHADMLPRGVWVYMRPLEYSQANKLARRIIQQRKNVAQQFRTWSSGTASQPGFAEFINSLDEGFFPNPSTARIIDPTNPQNRRVAAEILGGGTEIGNYWRRGHNQRERALRRELGLPYHRQFAFYYELCKAALIANFNPNTRINRFNPNAPAFTPVDKSDLVIIDTRDNRTPRKGYTTEFCFDAMGYFEITTLGDLAQVVGGASKPDSIFRRKMRTVVQVYDVLRHTSQFHFERTFANRFGLSSRSNRRNVVTWPEPMEALTEAVTQGSKLDGRVELAGLKDGLRLQLPPSSREQTYRVPETVVMAMGFQDRTDTSFSQLRRLVRTNAIGTKEFSERLGDVLDANFSRVSPILRKRYRREELLALGAAQTSATAINQDATVAASDSDSDLRPDGLHTSLFTTGHLGAKFLLMPCHTRLGGALGGKGGRGQQVGAGFRQNLTGNVPYYTGGLAFWVKFEFDGDAPVFSGLVGATSVIEPVGPSPPKDSEGTQFYIFKNTKGQLRVVRMYYHQAFPPSGGEGGDGGGGDAQGLVLWPPVEVDDSGGSNNEDILDLDPRKPVARSDVIIPVDHFRAHEWHHIAVDWNDSSPSSALKVWIDFEPIQGGGPYIPQEEISDTPTAWVRLNCRDPRDGLFIGGFIRHQGVADAGVFKWFTNTLDGGGSGQTRRLSIVEPSVKKIVANATIDEFVTYTGTFSGVRSYFVPRGAPGYFSHQPGEYVNLMEIPLPPGVDHVVLRSFDWTAYYPTFFTGNDRQPRKIPLTTPIQAEVRINSPRLPPRFQDPWRTPTVANKVAGFHAGRARGSARVGSNAELVYRFTLPPGRAVSGSLAGGTMQTPVIDDVTLTYYLPAPKILHQEEAE